MTFVQFNEIFLWLMKIELLVDVKIFPQRIATCSLSITSFKRGLIVLYSTRSTFLPSFSSISSFKSTKSSRLISFSISTKISLKNRRFLGPQTLRV